MDRDRCVLILAICATLSASAAGFAHGKERPNPYEFWRILGDATETNKVEAISSLAGGRAWLLTKYVRPSGADSERLGVDRVPSESSAEALALMQDADLGKDVNQNLLLVVETGSTFRDLAELADEIGWVAKSASQWAVVVPVVQGLGRALQRHPVAKAVDLMRVEYKWRGRKPTEEEATQPERYLLRLQRLPDEEIQRTLEELSVEYLVLGLKFGKPSALPTLRATCTYGVIESLLTEPWVLDVHHLKAEPLPEAFVHE